MDTSKEYIELCKQATEIQELWQYEDGDYFQTRFEKSDGDYFKGRTIVTCLCVAHNIKDSYGDTYVNEDAPKGKYIWLPRQDQLQEMLTFDARSYLALIKDFAYANALNFTSLRNISVFSSMEQLWLAFVMYEKYQKKWNGKDWFKLPLPPEG